MSSCHKEQTQGVTMPKSILVVDDSFDDRFLACREVGLAFPQAKVYQAVDGKDGYLQYLSLRPDMVVTDINMPNMPGLVMAQEIFKIDEYAVIVIRSREKKIEELPEGIAAVIPKGVSRDEIINLLHQVSKNIRRFD